MQIDSAHLASKLRGTQLENLSCFFVSVTGPGVTFDYGPLNLGARDPACMGLGRTSQLVSLSTIGKEGVRIRTVAGPQRTVRLLGVKTTLTQCDGQPLSEIFRNRRPEIFEVASTTVDAFGDKRIDIVGTNDLTKVEDIVKPCDHTGVVDTGFSPVVLGTPNSAKLAVFATLSGNTGISIYRLNNALDIIFEDFAPAAVPAVSAKMRLQPDGGGFFLFSSPTPNTSYTKGVTINGLGQANLTLAERNFPHGIRNMDFSGDGRYAYAIHPAYLYMHGTRTGILTDLDPSYCNFPSANRLLATNNTIYFFTPYFTSKAQTPAPDSSLCSTSGTVVTGEAGTTHGIVESAYFYGTSLYTLETADSFSYLYRYKINSAGSWTESDPGVQVGVSQLEMAMLAGGKFIVVSDYPGSKLSTYAIDANGRIGATAADFINVPSPQSLTLDPLGRSAFVSTGTGASVQQFAIDANGHLSLVPPAGGGVSGDSIHAILALPIF